MTRPDEDIQTDIIMELQGIPELNVELVDVWCSDGVVGLAGSVQRYYDRWKVERVARTVSGVEAVVSYLEVTSPPRFERSDAEIVEECLRVLGPAIDRIEVRADAGVVTLRGTVARLGRAEAAEEAIRRLGGVRDVVNLIRVQDLRPSTLTGAHERALERS